MQTVRLPLLRGALFIIALAAISILLARGDNPAQATTYNPQFSISVSDPNPGAAADIVIDFSLDAPDSFPNVKTNSSIQFIPRQWGIHVPETEEEMAARIGGVAGTFNALSTLGTFGSMPCVYQIPVPFTMYDATPFTGYDAATGTYDPQKLTSGLDIGAGLGPGGSDLHPGGVGYSGQFAEDPNSVQAPTDITDPPQPLITFNADEAYNGGVPYDPTNSWASIYRDVDGDGHVSAGDVRLREVFVSGSGVVPDTFLEPGIVNADDWDAAANWWLNAPFPANVKHADPNGNGQMDAGEGVYRDVDWSGTVTYGDIRYFQLATLPILSVVQRFSLPGGVIRYPDFLNEMFDPAVVGEPLARMFGEQNVLDATMVSLNIVTYRPGQLPGYPASLGYPNVVVVLDPVAPIEWNSINLTSDLCTPLSLTSTNFGISRDNAATFGNEDGYVRLTNPKAEKSHQFTLVTTSQPDADSDGIENMLDTCAATPNLEDVDGRQGGFSVGHPAPGDPEGDALDAACDPDPNSPSPSDVFYRYLPDQDQDNYANRADNCPTVPNGTEVLDQAYLRVPGFIFYYGVTGDLIGPDSQADADGDDIGDACEGAETGAQCANDVDDDGDGYVNDGCPVDVVGSETGEQCLNAIDDDGDGKVNDGCPQFPLVVAETGDQCLNAVDDDGDGKVNDGCPKVGSMGEGSWGGGCSNAIDEDGDGYVNDGCPQFPEQAAERGFRCNNALDDDASWNGGPDGYVNDGCPSVILLGTVESGAQCDNNLDDDADGLVNDGCPAVDPGDVAKTTITGHMHVVTLTQGVTIARHGVKLDDVDGKEKLPLGGSATYKVSLENKGGSAEDFPVAVRVIGGCGTVSGPPTVHVNGDASANAQYTVDFSGCAADEYTVQADACHAGDPAPTGFFGAGGCPGISDMPQPPSGLLTPSGATASSEDFGAFYGAAKAIDNDTNTLWCTGFAPGVNIQASFASPVSVDRVDIEDSYGAWGYAFVTGTLSFSNGYSQDVTLTAGAGSFSVPLQSGVEWVKFTATTDAGAGAGCIGELTISGFVPPVGDTNLLDDAPRSMTVVVGTP